MTKPDRTWYRLDETPFLLSAYHKFRERRNLADIPSPENIVVRFTRRGNFTTATLQAEARDRTAHRRRIFVSTGTAKRNPHADKTNNPATGMLIALGSGLEDLERELF